MTVCFKAVRRLRTPPRLFGFLRNKINSQENKEQSSISEGYRSTSGAHIQSQGGPGASLVVVRGLNPYGCQGTLTEGGPLWGEERQEVNCPSGQEGPWFLRGLGIPPKQGSHGPISLKSSINPLSKSVSFDLSFQGQF